MTTPLVSASFTPQLTWLVEVGQVAKAWLSMSNWALQMKGLRIASVGGAAPKQKKAPCNAVVVWVVVIGVAIRVSCRVTIHGG